MMPLIKTVSELRDLVSKWKRQGLSIGFVPTMGNLHSGHLSLVDLAKQHADRVVVSIFVNPLQFGPNEDFDQYPRTLEADCQQLKQQGVDLVFAPSVNEMYPQGQIQTRVCAADALSNILEGSSRPQHFDGVTTVVAKLFHLVQPDTAIFGQKDYQQWRIVEQMVQDLSMPIEIVCAPIGRDQDGLALSSRNQYLDEQQRKIAPHLHQALKGMAQSIEGGQRTFTELEQQATAVLLQKGFDQVDYIKVVEARSLTLPVDADKELVILAVARLGKTRLLDNLIVNI